MSRLGVTYDVISPFAGTVERIRFRKGDKVEEGEVFFSLVQDGLSFDILSPVTGYADSLEVERGDRVIAGMILATIRQTRD